MTSAAVGALLCCCLLVFPKLIYADEDSANTTALPINLSRHDSRCGSACVLCAADGCVRCAELLVYRTGGCARVCPTGSHEAWARGDRLMGRVCYQDDYYSELMIGGLVGGALCLTVVVCGAAYARFRSRPRQRSRQVPQAPPPDQDNAKLRDFHKQLDCLRPHAYTLLSILNNTRRQVRELYLLGNNDAAMAYSCVLSDLAKLLLLLNKSQVPVVPEEWPRLASWAERILKRYTRMASSGPQQVKQLVNFLKTPASNHPQETQFSTFKSPSYASSSVSYSEDGFDKEFEWSDDLRPPSYSLIERELIPLSDPWGKRSIVRRESVWIEDEELKLARPQDELTTEL